MSTYDPLCNETFGADKVSSVNEAVTGSNCIIVVTPHSEFKSIDSTRTMKLAKPQCILFDGPRILDWTTGMKVGATYLGSGYGKARAIL